MKNKLSIGLDYWCIEMDICEVLKICKQKNLQIYDVQIRKHTVLFYAPIYERFFILHTFESCTLKKTTGVLGYILRSLKMPYRIGAVLLSMGLWYFFTHTIFTVEFQGEDTSLKEKIQQKMNEMSYILPKFQLDELRLKQDLKQQLSSQISWLEVEKNGSKLKVYYTPKKFAEENVIGNDVLVARQDGVIQRFDISHGNKVVKVNQVVHKGDVLVSNEMQDSNGITRDLQVEGRVFAYTWKDITLTIKDEGLPMFFVYFDLLMQARREVSTTFHKDDYIENENILHFLKEEGKIKMVIHYTLVQDITTP